MGSMVPWVGGKVRGRAAAGAGDTGGAAEGLAGSGPLGTAAGAMVRPDAVDPEGARAGDGAGAVAGGASGA